MIEEMSGDFFQQLRGFYYVAQLGSMGQAAKILHRSQSSVSRLIKQLEQSLGITLFSRVQKGVLLTEEGKELFKQSVEIFDKIRAIHSGLDCVVQEPSGSVAFMSSQISLMNYVVPLLGELHRAYPKIKLNIYETSGSTHLIKQLEDHSLDFALAVNEAMHSHLDFFPLFDTTIMLITPPDFEIEQEGEVDLAKLANRPFLVMPERFGFSKFIEHHMSLRGIFLEDVCHVPTMLLQMHMVSAGMGLAIVHDAALSAFREGIDLRVYSLAHLFPTQQYGVIYLKDSYMTPQARAVLKMMWENSKLRQDSSKEVLPF